MSKTTQPLVSIIIPSYNAEKYVREAVDSALAQTHKGTEVVVVDDGSTDNTREVLRPYTEAGRIKYVHQANKGLAGARNAGIESSSGDYVAFLDADDIFLPDKVEEQVGALEANKDYGVCYSDLLHFDNSGKLYHHRYKYPSGEIFEPLLHKQFINPLTVMARREIFEKYGYFDESLRRSEDWDMWLRLAHAGVKFYFLDKPLAKYRIQNNDNLSATGSEPEMKEKNLLIFERLGGKLSQEERDRYNFSRILKRLRLKAGIAYLMVGDKQQALRFADSMPLGTKTTVNALPASFWKLFWGLVRRIKHRSLLKRIELKR